MLKIQDLCFSLGEFSYNNLNFHINTGEYCIILGPTGAGKTILLETIAGIYHPDSGNIILNGRDITNTPPNSRKCGMVYQDYMLFPHMTVKENIAFGLKQAKIPLQKREIETEKIANLLEIGLLLDRYPVTLSGGEEQRTALARALLLKPDVLLLDEPLSALDRLTREKLKDELKQIQKETNMTILHITHHFEDIYALADKVIIMKDGIIIQQGTPDDIFHRPNSDFIAKFTGMDNTFSGIINNSEIRIGRISIKVDSNLSGNTKIGIRPEDIIITDNPGSFPEYNSIPGVIKYITDNGFYSSVSVDVGDEGVVFSVALTHQNTISFKVGSEVFIVFKKENVHVYRNN